MNSITEPSIVNYGVSEALIAEFDMLREVLGSDEQTKFSQKTVNTLAQHIVCRNYGSLCYEFAHVNWALIFAQSNGITNTSKLRSVGQTLLDFYWVTQCNTPLSFNAYFADLGIDEVVNTKSAFSLRLVSNQSNASDKGQDTGKIDDSPSASSLVLSGITLNIHEHTFSISANRANLLSCFMEWLICVVPNVLSLIETTLHGKGHNAIRELSSELQKQIYEYLKGHLPPAKLQLRYRLLQSWYQQSSNTEVSDINDSSILQFWLQHNSQEGYSKFSSVVKDSLSYQHALSFTHTHVNLHYASNSSLATERDSEHPNSQFQQNLLYSAREYYSEVYTIEAEALLKNPKAINKQQLELVKLAAYYPQYIQPLAKTWLRLQVFGKAQHQIIQFVRMQNLHIGCAEDYWALCEQNYEQIKYDCVTLMANNQQTLMAIVNIALLNTPKQACLILLKLMASLPSYSAHVNDFTHIIEQVSQCDSHLINDISAASLAQWQLAHPWLKELLTSCRSAQKRINREGFTAKTLLDAQQYTHCAQGLFDINKMLKQLVIGINKHQQQGALNFGADRLIFTNEFYTLYSKDMQ